MLTIFEDLCSFLSGFGPMASSNNRMLHFCRAFICLILFANTCHGFYFLGPNMYRHTFSAGDVMAPKVNPLTSVDTAIPFSYYSLPYCKPVEGLRKSEINIGQLLLGDQIMNSPYRFQMNVNQTVFLCIIDPLTADEAKLLKQRIRDMYQVNMMLDHLPVRRYEMFNDFKMQWTGFPVGYARPYNGDYYIYNHLKFRVLIHEHEGSDVKLTGAGEVGFGVIEEAGNEYASGFEIVGFEVFPCSVKHNRDDMSKLHMYETIQPINCPLDVEKSQVIRENETIAFTYEVEFVKSDIRWRSRWDDYLGMGSAKGRWFFILNSTITIFILAIIVLVIYMRAVRRELIQYEELNKEPQALPGWKLVAGDVFREPGRSKLLCVMVGDGVQITGMVVVGVVLSALGFVTPVSRGMLLTSLIMLYLFFGIAAGYAAVRLWRIIKGTSEGWKSVSCSVACFFPGIIFVVLMFSNILFSATKSTRVIPFSLFLILLFLWFCISVPLTLIGGFLGTKAELIEYPVRTNHIPREIPARKYRSWLLVLGAGIIPFGTQFVELWVILSSVAFGFFYSRFGFLLVDLLLLIVVCAIVSVILTYTRLRVEDWRWWWKAFFASGSVGIYVFLYLINYLVFDLLGMNGPVSAALYMGYSLIVAIAVMLATGTIGFLVSFYSVHRLYSSAKIDC